MPLRDFNNGACVHSGAVPLQHDVSDTARRLPVKRAAPLVRKTPLARTRKTSTAKLKRDALKAWGAYIHARDVFCLVCGKSDGKLDAHHVMIRSFAATATDENNGVLACYRCHQTLHSDPLIAVKFYTRHYGVEGYQALREKAYEGRNQVMRAAFWRDELTRLNKLLEAAGG